MQDVRSLLGTLLSSETSEVDRAASFYEIIALSVSADLLDTAIHALRQHMICSKLPGVEIDTCGTGGSGKQRINTSTMVAFILAACGVKVGKHGNKAASGRCGSFDLLASLGVKIDLTPAQETKIYTETGIAFLFAPLHHPSLKHVAPLRKAYGKRTLFNILGPLLSPADVPRQLLGTNDLPTAVLLSAVLQKRGKYGSKVVVGSDGLDEVTVTGPTTLCTVKAEKIEQEEWQPSSLFDAAQVQGGSIEENMKIFTQVLTGSGTPAHTALVTVNAAHALQIARPTMSLQECLLCVRDVLDSKKAYELFERYRDLSLRI